MLNKIRISLLFLVISFVCSAAYADPDYSITGYTMDIELQSDGSAYVTENLIYRFSGEYNGILSLFDAEGLEGLGDFRVYADGVELAPVDEMTYIPGTYTLETDGSLTEIRVYSPGRSDTRLFTYEYTMAALAERYNDSGMIYRKLIGSEHTAAYENAVVTVHLPASGNVLAYVHGGMEGSDIHLNGNQAVFGPARIDADEYVEMRILFPAEWIADAPLKEESIRESAISEEQRLIEEANSRALRLSRAKVLFALLYTLIFLAVWALMARRYGLRSRKASSLSIETLASYPAAFAAAALEDEPDTNALCGTLIELTRSGVIRMQSENNDLRFTLAAPAPADLLPHQAQLISWLFADSESFLLSSLNAGKDYECAQAFEKGYASYCAAVNTDMASAGLSFRNDGVRIFVNALIIVLGAMGASGILMAGDMHLPLGIAVIASGALLLALMSRIRRLTDSGEALKNAAAGLKAKSPLNSDHLLQLLPYLTALGMTEPLITRPIHSDAMDSAYGSSWHICAHMMTARMHEAHTHNASLPDPNASSHSSGSSGGGGGGHGAW